MKNSGDRTIRVFFAIDLTPEAVQHVTAISNVLQNKHKQHSIRWTKPHNLHVTLQFLAAVKEDDLDNLIKNVRAELSGSSAFELELGELELFPTPYRPHIISIRVVTQDIPADLAKRIGKGIAATGYEIEMRPFRGHLTLARLPRNNKAFTLAEIPLPAINKIPVNEIHLYRSEPAQGSSRYTKLLSILLLDAPSAAD